MIRKISLLFILFFIANVFAKFDITKYDENVKFTDSGREVEVRITGIVALEPNYYQESWGFIFDKKQTIKIENAKVVGRDFETTFKNNQLTFKFTDAFDGDTLIFEFKYIENSKNSKYNRNEWVSIPPFAEGADATLIVEIPTFLEIYSLHPKFLQNYNIYSWKGKIGKDGFDDYFRLTTKKAKWNATATIKITANSPLRKLNIVSSQYFKNGNSQILAYKILTDGKYKEENDKIKISYDDIEPKEAIVKITATLLNDYDNKTWINLNPNNYLKIDSSLSQELQDILYKINVNSSNTSLPLHVKIAEWVNNHIKYNLAYFGKDMTTKEIINIGKGICEHYAQLYNDLLRATGIPSAIVSGMSYDTEKNKFESHAWNLVYINGEWIGIDPTWGIYSGKLPISHIFFNFKDRKNTELEYSTFTKNTNSKLKREVEFIE
jgi:hypothetical protein